MAKFVAEKACRYAEKAAKTAMKGKRLSAVYGRKIPCVSLFLSRAMHHELQESLMEWGFSA